MATEAVWESIMAQVAIDLAVPDGTGSWNYDIQRVSRDPLLLQQIDSYPCVQIEELDEAPHMDPDAHSLTLERTVRILATLRSNPSAGGTSMSTQLSRLYRDIRLVMCGSAYTHHNRTCEFTRYLGCQYYHADAKPEYPGLAMTFKIIYFSPWDAP